LGLSLALFGAVASAGFPPENVDPDSEGLRYAWSENGGWINAEPDGESGRGLYVPDSGQVRGWLWSENFGWISADCQNTGPCPVAFGVEAGPDNADPQSILLSGYGWGENIGWVSFSCQNTASCLTADYGVRIDRASGLAFGYAWSENVGWISFGCLSEDSCAQQSFGIKVAVAPLGDAIFGDGFENPFPP
jgi:hypothetical protein